MVVCVECMWNVCECNGMWLWLYVDEWDIVSGQDEGGSWTHLYTLTSDARQCALSAEPSLGRNTHNSVTGANDRAILIYGQPFYHFRLDGYDFTAAMANYKYITGATTLGRPSCTTLNSVTALSAPAVRCSLSQQTRRIPPHVSVMVGDGQSFAVRRVVPR